MILACLWSVIGATGGCGKSATPAANTGAATRTNSAFTGKPLELLEAASRHDEATVARLMKDEHFDPDQVFSADAMPLVAWPMVNGDLDGLKLLLKYGADPNARMLDQTRVTGRIRNNALVYAAAQPDSSYLSALLDHGGNPDTKNTNEEPLTRVATLADQWKNVQILIERGADTSVTMYGGHGNVASWYSIRGDFDKVYWLMERGITVTGRMKIPNDPTGQGAMPVVEEIFYLPVKPEMQVWQDKCQALLRRQGVARPALPTNLKERRQKLGLEVDESKIPQA